MTNTAFDRAADVSNPSAQSSETQVQQSGNPPNPAVNPPQNPPVDSSHPPVNPPNARIPPTDENPHGYPPFELRHLPTYTNNQLRYYHTSGAMLDVDETEFRRLVQKRKDTLEMLDWDGNTRQNTPAETAGSVLSSLAPTEPSSSHQLSFDYDGEADSDCPTPPLGYKGIKLNPSDITQLRYDSNVGQFNSWIEDLKSAFDGDASKYPTSRQKIIFASMTIDEQLKMTYNTIVRAHPAIATHWRKFKRWIQDVVLHGDSDRQKMSSEFTMARQRVTEDPNQFYLRLLNLGIQSDRPVHIQDYRTRLVKPLLTLINQQDRTYTRVQDLVGHAGRFWQTLDLNKLRQEIKEERSQRYRSYDRQQNSKTKNNRNNDQQQAESSSRQQSKPNRKENRQNSRQANKPRLSQDEQQHRAEKNLCFNCGYPGHRRDDCTYSFNPNRVVLRDDNQVKTQSLRGQKRQRVKAQPVHASDDAASVIHTTEEDSDYDGPEIRPSKRSKN